MKFSQKFFYRTFVTKFWEGGENYAQRKFCPDEKFCPIWYLQYSP